MSFHLSKTGKAVALVFTALFLLASTAGCAQKPAAVTIVKVGTTSDEPRVWDAVNKNLAKDNIQVKIVNFANGANPNQALADGEIDLNAFQHYAYLNQNIKDLKLNLTAIGDTLIVPLNLYSKSVKSVDEIPSGAKIAVPNDVTNEGRALIVLKNARLIQLRDGSGQNPTKKDITANPKNLQFVELAGAQIPRSLPDVAAAVINCGYAVDAGLDPIKDPIYKDQIDLSNPEQKPYINIIVARTKDKDNPVYQKVVKAYQTESVADAIKTVYKGSAIPAWDEKYAQEANAAK